MYVVASRWNLVLMALWDLCGNESNHLFTKYDIDRLCMPACIYRIYVSHAHSHFQDNHSHFQDNHYHFQDNHKHSSHMQLHVESCGLRANRNRLFSGIFLLYTAYSAFQLKPTNKKFNMQQSFHKIIMNFQQ